MQTINFKEISKVSSLFKHSRLAGLLKKTQVLKRLEASIHSTLPEDLYHTFQVANMRENKVILHAKSSTVATRLSYCIPQILDVLHAQPEFADVATIECKVRP